MDFVQDDQTAKRPERQARICQPPEVNWILQVEVCRWSAALRRQGLGQGRLAHLPGADDANHAENGIFIWNMPGETPANPKPYSIYDIAPSVLKYFGIEIPDDMIGKPVF